MVIFGWNGYWLGKLLDLYHHKLLETVDARNRFLQSLSYVLLLYLRHHRHEWVLHHFRSLHLYFTHFPKQLFMFFHSISYAILLISLYFEFFHLSSKSIPLIFTTKVLVLFHYFQSYLFYSLHNFFRLNFSLLILHLKYFWINHLIRVIYLAVQVMTMFTCLKPVSSSLLNQFT